MDALPKISKPNAERIADRMLADMAAVFGPRGAPGGFDRRAVARCTRAAAALDLASRGGIGTALDLDAIAARLVD